MKFLLYFFICLNIVILSSCGAGPNKNSMTVLQSINESQIIDNVCGESGVKDIVIKNTNGTPLHSTLSRGDKLNIMAVVECNNPYLHADVTNLANWKISDDSIIRINDNLGGSKTINSLNSGISLMSVNFDKYSVNAKIEVNESNSALNVKDISINDFNQNNTLIKGQAVSIAANAIYNDGSIQTVSNATLSTNDTNIIAIKDNQIIGLESGNFTINVNYAGKTSSLNGVVSPASIVGIRINDQALGAFSIAMPRTFNVTGQFIFSDGTTADIPPSTLENPNLITCSLYHLPNDTSVPFINNSNNCQISSTASVGSNRLIYTFTPLNKDGTTDMTKPSFESDIIIQNTDTGIKDIQIVPSQDLGSMFTGQAYRYRVIANMNDGSSNDITKYANLQVSCEYNSADCSDNILNASTGYIGTGIYKQDDGLGGVLQIIGMPDSSNSAIFNLTLSTSISGFESQISVQANVMGRNWTIAQLSTYFVNNVFNTLSDNDKKAFSTLESFDTNGNPIFNRYNYTFAPIRGNQLVASVLANAPNTISVNSFDNNTNVTLTPVDNTNLPSVSETSYDADNDLGTIMCNNTSYNQTMTSASQSKSYSTSYTDAFTFGFSTEQEISFFDIGKSKITLNTSYQHSNTTSSTVTYTLPSQNILLPPHAKAVITQQMLRLKEGGIKNLTLPLNQNSCIPFVVTGNMPLLSITSNACMRLSSLSQDAINKMGVFGQMISNGNSSLTFQMSYKNDSITNNTSGNIVSVYVYNPGDPGYDSISCNDSMPTNMANKQLSRSMINRSNPKFQPNPKNLVSLKTYN